MTAVIEFKAWPKTPRLFRDCVITEKIDGTNAAIGILPIDDDGWQPSDGMIVVGEHCDFMVYAQSRKRIITPDADNFSFARWVYDNADTLVADLGPGLHFGEWWGQGIQRGYGLTEKRFSLFNVGRFEASALAFTTPRLGLVPVLARYTFDTPAVTQCLQDLAANGSVAVPGFDRPEGVVVYHAASGQTFKALIENDQGAKSDLAA